LFLRFSRLLMPTLGAFFMVLPAGAASPITIIARTGTASGDYTNGTNYVSWTQTGTFSNVTIQANLFSTNDGTATGNAYLTTGFTSATQIGATVPISVSNTDRYNPTTVTLFSGLTLGPGTYYLTISDPNYGLAWEAYVSGIVTTTAPGVTAANEDGTYGTFPVGTSYPPAATFTYKSANLIFNVTSIIPDPVPALSGWTMLGTALLLITSGLFLMRLYRPQE
jgi:hypothetical protein